MSIHTVSFDKPNLSWIEIDVAGRIQYYYADRFVGSADLIFEKGESVPYPFHNIDSDKGGSDISFFRFDYKVILIILAGVLATYIIIRVARAKSGTILLKKKRRKDVKRKRKPRYTVIDRNRNRNRRKRRRKW